MSTTNREKRKVARRKDRMRKLDKKRGLKKGGTQKRDPMKAMMKQFMKKLREGPSDDRRIEP